MCFRVPFVLAALVVSAAAEDTIKSKVIDAENHAVTETVADTKGRVLKKTKFFFDANNWSKGAIHFDAKDNIKYKEIFKRDTAGKILEARLFSKDDQPLGRRAYQYDASGALLRIDDYDASDRLIPQTQRAVPVKKKR